MAKVNYNDVLGAYIQAKEQLKLIEREAHRIGALAIQPVILRNMYPSQLGELKRQLKYFNIHTGAWK